MKECRRCGSSDLRVVRESVSSNGRHQYAVWWLQCPRCQELRLSFRPFSTSLSTALKEDAPEVNTPGRSPSAPVMSR